MKKKDPAYFKTVSILLFFFGVIPAIGLIAGSFKLYPDGAATEKYLVAVSASDEFRSMLTAQEGILKDLLLACRFAGATWIMVGGYGVWYVLKMHKRQSEK